MDVLTEKIFTEKDLMKLSCKGRYELIKGVVYEMSPGGQKHGFIASRIGYIISNYVYENKLGITTGAETGYKLCSNPDTVRSPDMAFESNEKLKEKGIIDGYSSIMPDLVVEVNSPSDSYVRIIKKVNEWLDAGVNQVWVIDPDDCSVAVYYSPEKYKIYNSGDTLSGGEILPGFKCKVEDIFTYSG